MGGSHVKIRTLAAALGLFTQIFVPGARGETEVTLYPQGKAYVHETIKPPASGDWTIRDFPTTLDLSSLLVSPEGTRRVLEQRFRQNRIVEETLSSKRIGSKVQVISDNFQREGTLVGWWTGADGKRWNAVQIGNDLAVVKDAALVFVETGETPYTPELRLRLSEGTDDSPVHFRYLASGFDWKAEYALFQEDGRGVLRGSIGIDNYSGRDFKGVKLALVAGERKRAVSPPTMAAKRAAPQEVFLEGEPSAPEAASFGDVVRIEIPGVVDIAEGETQSITWFQVGNIPLTTAYLLDFTRNQRPARPPYLFQTEEWIPVTSRIVFLNNRENLGIPLAAGLVRVYERQNGKEGWMGEDPIPNVSVGDEVRLETGTSFDLKGKRIVEDLKTILEDKEYEESVLIQLANRGEQEKTIRVKEPLEARWTWTIVETSHPYTRPDAGTLQWDVAVPGKSEVSLKARYRYRR